MFRAKENRKLVIGTYIALTLGLTLIYFLIPNSYYSYKLAAIIIWPIICWLPFDIKWFKMKRQQYRERQLQKKEERL